MHQITKCPICGEADFIPLFDCKDYTQSQEWFSLIRCKHCQFTMTSPRPDTIDLGNYYKANNYISHSDTSKGLINKLYKFVRNFTLHLKIRWIQNLQKKGKLIDIGSGAGYFLDACKKSGYDVIGIEPDEPSRNLSFHKFKVECFPESHLDTIGDKEVDLITMWHVLEHVPELASRLKQIQRILKPSGFAIIAVPNCNSFDANYYQSQWAAYDVPRHLWHFSPDNIIQLLGQHGFECIKIKPMFFDAFYVSMLSESYKSNPLALIKGSFIGLLSNILACFSKKAKSSSQVYVFRKLVREA
ncbi:MAG: class I SAM-dependent methyltransferase [Saprospiraceae bacterium]|nr:class I SAM-dependent methyltransferase [Saprospiraceae bacterium]